MQYYTNERLRCHTPRPPQPQVFTISNSYQASGPEVLGPFPDPQVEAAEGPLYDPHLFEIDEQSPLVHSYENTDGGSQSSAIYSAEGPSHMPHINGVQGYSPRPPSFSQHDYRVGLPQVNDVLQTGEDSRSVDTAFLQQGNHMGLTPTPWESSTTSPPEFEHHRVNHVSRNLQPASRTGGRPTLQRHSHLDTSSPATFQTPLAPSPFPNHANTSDRQVNPLEPATEDGMDPSLDLPFDDGMLDSLHGNWRNDLAGNRRRISMDSGLPNNATSRVHNRHIGPSVSEPRRHSQSSYSSIAQHHRASAFQSLSCQPQDQGARRGLRGSTSPAQNVTSYGIPSLNNDEFARNTPESIEGIQAGNSPEGNPETYLHPRWQPARKASSETYGDARSDVSDEEVRQWPHIAPRDQHRVPTRGYKRELSPDAPTPTTPQARPKRPKRKFSPEERAVIKRKRETGACDECRRAKRKCTHESPGVDSSPGAQSFSGISSTRSTPSRPEE